LSLLEFYADGGNIYNKVHLHVTRWSIHSKSNLRSTNGEGHKKERPEIVEHLCEIVPPKARVRGKLWKG
jgi:hypothetical protein